MRHPEGSPCTFLIPVRLLIPLVGIGGLLGFQLHSLLLAKQILLWQQIHILLDHLPAEFGDAYDLVGIGTPGSKYPTPFKSPSLQVIKPDVV